VVRPSSEALKNTDDFRGERMFDFSRLHLVRPDAVIAWHRERSPVTGRGNHGGVWGDRTWRQKFVT